MISQKSIIAEMFFKKCKMSKINYRQLNVILKVISLSSKIFRIIKLYKYINIKLHKCTKEFRKTHSQKKKTKNYSCKDIV